MTNEKPDAEFDKALESLVVRWQKTGETMPVNERNPNRINTTKLAKLLGQSRQTLSKKTPLGLERREKINAVAIQQGLEPWPTTEEQLRSELNSSAEHYKNKAAENARAANDAKMTGALSSSQNEALMIELANVKASLERAERENISLRAQLNEFADTGLIRGINRG